MNAPDCWRKRACDAAAGLYQCIAAGIVDRIVADDVDAGGIGQRRRIGNNGGALLAVTPSTVLLPSTSAAPATVTVLLAVMFSVPAEWLSAPICELLSSVSAPPPVLLTTLVLVMVPEKVEFCPLALFRVSMPLPAVTVVPASPLRVLSVCVVFSVSMMLEPFRVVEAVLAKVLAVLMPAYPGQR